MFIEPSSDQSFQDRNYRIYQDRDLTGFNFSHALLRFSRFYGCNLQGADFSGADLTGAIFHECNLTEVKISSLKLPTEVEILQLIEYAIDGGFTYNMYPLVGSLIENPTAGGLLLAIRLPYLPRQMLDSPVRSRLSKAVKEAIAARARDSCCFS